MSYFRWAVAAACVFAAASASASHAVIEFNGSRYEYNDANADISVRTSYGVNDSVQVSINGPNTWSNITFAAPRGTPLRTGRYYDAERAAFRNGRAPGLDASFTGSGCNRVWGDFEIRQIEFSPTGEVLLLDATAYRRCESPEGSLLKATVKFNADPLSFAYESTKGDPLGLGARRTFLGDRSVFALTGTAAAIDYAVSGMREEWAVRLRPPTGTAFAPGTYATARTAGPGVAGLDVAGEGRECASATGTLTITSLRKTAGKVTGLNASFSLSCDGKPPFKGTIRHFR